MRLIDSHCHLDFPVFDEDRDAVCEQAAQLGIEGIVVPGVTRQGWAKLNTLRDHYRGIACALGLHPMFLEQHGEGDIDALREAVERWHPVAIGEIGLDYYLPELDRDRQRVIFESQLQITQLYELPVILHVRKAHDEVLSCLRRYSICGGIVHAFSGSLPQAMRYIEMGFCLGIGGAITHERALRMRKVISQLPLNALVLETDAPDMAPAGHQGERNTPLNIGLVLSVLSGVVGLDADTLSDITSANLERVLKCTFDGVAVRK